MGQRPTKGDEDAELTGESACPTWTKPWGGRFRLPTLRARTTFFSGVTMGLLAHQR
jgi:hypothetical protein